MSRSGGRILVDQLEAHGVDLAFGVPGESYLAVLDAPSHDHLAYRPGMPLARALDLR